MEELFQNINRELETITGEEHLEERVKKQYSLEFHSMEMREGYHIDWLFCDPDLKNLEEYEKFLNGERTN